MPVRFRYGGGSSKPQPRAHRLAAHAQGEPGRHARGGLSETGFPCRWQHVNLYGRYEFRKQPVDVDEIFRELAEIRIGTETALAT
jgi:hypothetical protein